VFHFKWTDLNRLRTIVGIVFESGGASSFSDCSGKAILTTEGMGLLLYPEFDFNRELKPFVQKAWQSYWSPKRLPLP